MEALLIAGVYMICVALFGLNVLFILYMKQGQPQTVLVWSGESTDVIRHRMGFISNSGNMDFFGNGELSLPLGLKNRAGQKVELLIVHRRTKDTGYV